MREELARKEVEINGSRWLVTVESYWVIPGKPEELVYCIYKQTPQGGWAYVKGEKAPRSVCWAGTCFLAGFEAGMERKVAR